MTMVITRPGNQSSASPHVLLTETLAICNKLICCRLRFGTHIIIVFFFFFYFDTQFKFVHVLVDTQFFLQKSVQLLRMQLKGGSLW